MLLAGIEPASPPSEGGILSIERQERQASRAGIHETTGTCTTKEV